MKVKIDLCIPTTEFIEDDSTDIYVMLKESDIGTVGDAVGLSLKSIKNSVTLHANHLGWIGDSVAGAVFAKVDGCVVGLVTWSVSDFFFGEDKLLCVSHFIVHPSYRYKKVAIKLLRHVKESCKEQGMKGVIMSTTYSDLNFANSLERKHKQVSSSYLIEV